jgi:hypothetical protein
MDRIWVSPAFADDCRKLGLCRTEDFAKFFGMDRAAGTKSVELRQGKIGDVPVFYKQYDHPPASWRYLGRKSKARREFLNYQIMQRLGVRCATPAACGERRDRLGRLERAFIITVSIPDAQPLAEFVKLNQPGREARQIIVRELADTTRRAHDGRFIHRDLWVRNVLVNWQAPDKPAVWWIDSPKGAIWKLLTPFGKVLDLASLNKGAPAFTTRTERLRFLREYLGKNKKGQLKKLARKVIATRV